MTVETRTLHVEQLLSRPVRDSSGRMVGRLEEVRVIEQEGELFVCTFDVGPDALLERLAVGLTRFPLARALGLGKRHRGYRVPWDKLDLADPDHLRLTCPASELEPLGPL